MCQVTKGAHAWSWHKTCGFYYFQPATNYRVDASVIQSDSGVNIVAQLQHFFLKISLEGFVKKFLVCFIVALMSGVASFANDEHEEDRVKDAGVVLKEILNIPDDLPQDLLDKAECLVILPSVKKGAFGIGGSYGRGVMVCRSGEHYKGKWGAPALYALEGVSIGFQLAAKPPTLCCS